jgi:hypothetical protein
MQDKNISSEYSSIAITSIDTPETYSKEFQSLPNTNPKRTLSNDENRLNIKHFSLLSLNQQSDNPIGNDDDIELKIEAKKCERYFECFHLLYRCYDRFY